MQKRVLLISSEFPPLPGGIGNHALNLAQHLTSKKYKIVVLTNIREKNVAEDLQFDQSLPFKVVRVKRYKYSIFTYLKRIFLAFQLANKQDIILCSGKYSLWLGSLLKYFLKVKTIGILHGSELLLSQPLLKKITAHSLQKLDGVIAVSNYTKSLVSHLKVKHIEVIPNGFYISPQNETIKSISEKLQLITVGNVTQRKGQHNVINALPLLVKHFPEITYHIVGIPTEKEKLTQLAQQKKVSSHIQFHGKVNEVFKIQLLNQSSIFVMLSEHTPYGAVEGFGIAILEANALGLPAIGALNCGIEDAIKERYSGKLVAHNNAEAFSQAVIEITNNYKMYSKNATAWAANFTWDKIIEHYHTFFKKILKN